MTAAGRVALCGVAVGYGDRSVLSGIQASALEGRITAVVGPNAAGKSTLLRAIGGLSAPLAGRIEIAACGRTGDPVRWSGRERAATIASMPQQIRLPAGFSVEEIVAMGRHALERSPARVQAAIERFGLGELADAAVHTLSVGQQQRVGLARIAAQHESGGVIVLDEPFAALDLRELARAMAWLRSCADAGAVVVCSLHDLGFAARVADDAWLLDRGSLAGAGEAASVLAPAALEAIFGEAAIRLFM